MSAVADVVDKVLEAPVVTSFTKVGYALRRRLDDWSDLDTYRLDGRTILLTGGTSGLGRAAALRLARAGADLTIVGRDLGRTERVRDELRREAGTDSVHALAADMGELEQVRAAADQLADRVDALDVLIHNAGALSATRHETSAGIEATVASQVVGPHLMTALLVDRLRAAAPGRVITMTSGGMYTAGLTVSGLEMARDRYKGAEQYARAKRAQVAMSEMWAERVPTSEVVFHTVHPGWADTPGVEAALPTFRRIVGPLLRDAAEGADTLVWLAADDGAPLESSGDLWLDRRRRPAHRLSSTRRTDTPERRAELWQWVEAQAGLAST